MKKVRYLLLVFAVILLLTACSGRKDPSAAQTTQPPTEPVPTVGEPLVDDRTVITAVVARNSEKTDEFWKFLEDSFEEENPEFNLEITCVSWHDIDATIRELIAAGNTPDLVNTDNFRQHQKEGLLLSADQWVSQETYNKFYPELHERATADGKVWGIPDHVSARALYYNVDILEAAGVAVPTSWNELTAACKQIRAYNYELYPWGVDMTMDEGYATFAYYVWNNGSDLMDEYGNWMLNDPKNLSAVEYITGMVQSRLTNPDPTAQTRYRCQELFGQGKIAMMIAPSSLPAYCAADGNTVNYGIAPLPSNGDNPSISTATGNFILCYADESRTERELAAITAIVDAIYEESNYVQWVQSEGFLPATTTGNALLSIQDPEMAVWDQILGSLKFFPDHNDMWSIAREDICKMLQNVQWEGNIWLQLERLQEGITNP